MARITSFHKKNRNGTTALPWWLILAVGYLLGYLHGTYWNGGGDVVASLPSLQCALQGFTHQDKRDGWKAINVYYGDKKHLSLPPKKKWFSQACQDQAVVALFKQKRGGFFIDLAANHAHRLSNSLALERSYGWKGICVEPNPKYWPGLSYRDCYVAAAVAGARNMEEVHFRFDNGVFGGIAGEGFDNLKEFKNVSEPRFTVTLKEILERAEAPHEIDYLSLDVEGAEAYILEHFPFENYHIKVMSVERPRKFIPLLESKGFQMIRRLSAFGETLWVHKSSIPELDMNPNMTCKFWNLGPGGKHSLP